MNRIIGLPAKGPELADDISEHFGHCNYFVGIKVKDNNILEKAFALQNNGHSSCMEPVINMKERNITDMIVGGIGGRPFMGFLQVGINLYQGINGSIKKNIEFLLNGELKPLGEASCASSSSGNTHHN